MEGDHVSRTDAPAVTMDPETIYNVAEQVPALAVLVFLVYWFLRSMRVEREAAQKERRGWLDVVQRNTAVIAELKGIISHLNH